MSTTGECIVVDPTGGTTQRAKSGGSFAKRPQQLDGSVIAVISSGSPRSGPEVLDAFCRELEQQYGVARFIRVTKATTSSHLSKEEFDKLASEAKAAVIGIGV